MENKNMLLDSYYVEGSDINEFYEQVIAMSKRTHIHKIFGSDVSFGSEYTGKFQNYNVNGTSNVKADMSSFIAFYHLTAANLEKIRNNVKNENEKPMVGVVQKSILTPELISELSSGTGLIMCCERGNFVKNRSLKTLLVSNNTLKTLSQRVELGGNNFFTQKGFFRDLYLASIIFEKNIEMTIVYREIERAGKLFATFSNKYHCTIKQDILVDVMKHPNFAFKDFTMKSYRIDNFITEAILVSETDPETGITPGIIITNSDTGYSSFSIQTAFFAENSYVIHSEFTIKHSKKLKVDNILSTFDNAKKSLEKASFIKDMAYLKRKKLPLYNDTNDDILNIEELINKSMNVIDFINKQLSEVYSNVMSKVKQNEAATKIASKMAYGKEYNYLDFAIKLIEAASFFPELDHSTNVALHRIAYNTPKVLKKIKSDN